jgi:hypothetical protein
MGAFEALEVFDNVQGLLREQFPALPALVLGVDRQRLIQGLERLLIASLIKLDAAVEF